MGKEKSIKHNIISKVIGLIIFIVIMIILNNYHSNNSVIIGITEFLNNNFLFIITMSIVLFIADIFYALIIPFSLPAPIFSAIGGVLIVSFIFRIFGLIGTILREDILTSIMWLRWIIYPLVFIIALIAGYASILFGAFQVAPKKEKMINITPKKHMTWKDVGNELRNTLYDLLHRIRKRINKR